MPRCTAVLTTELPGRAFARILRTPVPHCESCFPLLLEPHLVVPRPGGTGGRWQGTAQGHASSRRSRPLSPADDQDTRGTHHPLPALHPPQPQPSRSVSLPTSPVLGTSPQSRQLPGGPWGVCPPGRSPGTSVGLCPLGTPQPPGARQGGAAC